MRRAEVPLLADNLPKRTRTIGRPAQDEFLCPRNFFLFKDKRYQLQPLRLVENQPNRLGSRFGGAPTLCFPGSEGRLDRVVFFLGVISTMAARSTSTQPSPRDRTVPCVGVISRLRIDNSVYLRSDSGAVHVILGTNPRGLDNESLRCLPYVAKRITGHKGCQVNC
jgi:hypothetical protein